MEAWDQLPVPSDPAPYCHTTRSAFLRVLSDFRDFFLLQDDLPGLRALVRRDAGRRLSLGIPHNWFLQLCPREQYAELRDHITGDLVCCDERLTLLGRCVVRLGADVYDGTGLAVFLGRQTRIYVYDLRDEATVLVAPDLDKLARFGIVGCEYLYRHHRTPRVTSTPTRLVAGLLLRQNDASALSTFARDNRGRDVHLHTPGYRALPMKLLGSFEDLVDFWPFGAMRMAELRDCEAEITERLCCRWHLFAAVGFYDAGSAFNVLHVLTVDRFGALYTLDVTERDLYRVADDLEIFLRSGIAKTLVPPHRFDSGMRGVARVERPPICPHRIGGATVPSFADFDLYLSGDYARQYRWLCRNDRFKPDMRTWDADDRAAIIRERVRHGEFGFEDTDSSSDSSASEDDSDAGFVSDAERGHDENNDDDRPPIDDGVEAAAASAASAGDAADVAYRHPAGTHLYLSEGDVSLEDVEIRRISRARRLAEGLAHPRFRIPILD